jgi:hypothetical protein
VDRLNGTPETKASSDFLKSEIGLFGQNKAHLLAVAAKNHGLATAAVMKGLNTAGVAALLDELLDHAKRNFEAHGYLLAGDISTVIGLEDAFA